MSVEGSNTEARILQAEREVYRLYHELAEMSTWRIRALEESLAMNWTLGPRKSAQVAGTVYGCDNIGFPGAAVAVKNAGGTTLGTATADSNGDYTVSVSLDTDPQSLNVVGTAAGAFAARFGGPVTVNIPAAHAGGNGAPNIIIPPAMGWCCEGGTYYPVNTSDATFVVRGCSGILYPGVTVNLYQSAVLIDSAVSNGSGEAVFTALPTGSYDVEAIPPDPGFAVFAATVVHGCDDSFGLNLTPDTGYHCIGCLVPVPDTIYTSDGEGTHALTWSFGNTWIGIYNFSGQAYDSTCSPHANLMQVTITAVLGAVSSNLTIAWTYFTCLGPVTRYRAAGVAGVFSNASVSDSSPTTCSPFSVAFSMPTFAAGGPGGGLDTPGGGGAMALTL